MAKCTPKLPTVAPIAPEKATELKLDVIPRFKNLMTSSVGEDSLYERSKKTIWELSKDLNMTEAQRMDIVAGQITQMTVGITSGAMAQALAWAEADAGVGYATAKLKAEALLTETKAETEAQNVCKTQYESELVCANIESTIATSIRENGKVVTYDPDNTCKPTELEDGGLKYEQTKQVKAATYQVLADAFRKSGVVQIGMEAGITKGITGDADGHTRAQTSVANRQVLSFEDSKRNHAVNASSQTIGQIIAAQAQLDDQIVQNYNKGMEYLLTDSIPVVPGGNADLDAVVIDWLVPGSDSVNDTVPGDEGDLVVQQVHGQVTFGVTIPSTANTRAGDFVVLDVGKGNFISRYNVIEDGTGDLITEFTMTFPTVNYDVAGPNTMVYLMEVYVQDIGGSKSLSDNYDLSIKYTPYS